MESWHLRFRKMKKGLGMTNKDISDITGNTAESIKTVTQRNNEIPRWLKLAIVIFERMSTGNENKSDINNSKLSN